MAESKQATRVKRRPGHPSGSSGNPAGRPKKTPRLVEYIRKLASDQVEVVYNKQKFKGSRWDAVTWVAFQQAQEGSSAARDWLSERYDGKVTQPVRVDERVIRVTINGVDDTDAI